MWLFVLIKRELLWSANWHHWYVHTLTWSMVHWRLRHKQKLVKIQQTHSYTYTSLSNHNKLTRKSRDLECLRCSGNFTFQSIIITTCFVAYSKNKGTGEFDLGHNNNYCLCLVLSVSKRYWLFWTNKTKVEKRDLILLSLFKATIANIIILNLSLSPRTRAGRDVGFEKQCFVCFQLNFFSSVLFKLIIHYIHIPDS